jgi:flavin-dependent dehydrogenase
MAKASMKSLPKDWDAIVIGAGPAGAVSALLLAREGKKVLLIDRANFPRDKVCGSCLSAKTVGYLAHAGLQDLPAQLGAAPINGIKLCTAAGALPLPLTGGLALSRAALDNAIALRAQAAGAVFLPATCATVGSCSADKRMVKIQSENDTVVLSASCVLVADGINGRALAELEGTDAQRFKPVQAPASRIGAGAVVTATGTGTDTGGHYYASGTIYMALHRAGYVGLVRLEDGAIDIAAAFDPAFTRNCGSLEAASCKVLQSVGLPFLDAFAQSNWHGTAPLTRHRPSPAGERLFVLGDAASYSEPFTGEGIGWAVRSALLVVPIACQAIKQWDDKMASVWQREYKKKIAAKQSLSRMLGLLLRHEVMSQLVLGGVLKHMPSLASPLVNGISQPPDRWHANPLVKGINQPMVNGISGENSKI